MFSDLGICTVYGLLKFGFTNSNPTVESKCHQHSTRDHHLVELGLTLRSTKYKENIVWLSARIYQITH